MSILKELWTKEVEAPEVKNSYQYVFELREKLEDTLKIAHEELQKAKHYYDCKTKVRQFQQGDKVLVLVPTDHNKLLMQWNGPYKVSAVVGINDYKVRVKDKLKVYHANLLKAYIDREEELGEAATTIDKGLVTSMSCSGEPSELELDPDDDNTDILEIGRYVAKESIADDKFFSKINLRKGYWQVTIPEVDISKTAFVTPDGLYEFLKMPFSMVNSVATLKCGMQKLLKGMTNVKFYWDDILVHTRTWKEHLKILRELFRRLAQASMMIGLSKCIFGVDSIDFLGSSIAAGFNWSP